jgi:hypothetical protein
MNAIYKILGLSACALLVFKMDAQPTHQALLRANAQLQQAQEQSRKAQRMLDVARALPPYHAHLLEPDQALSAALDTLQSQAADHGIKITQIAARDVPITQQVFATTSLRQEDSGTGTLRQKLTIKGSYIDLAGLRSYLQDVLSPSRGMVVNDLTIKGDTVEVGLGIHSSKDETKLQTKALAKAP